MSVAALAADPCDCYECVGPEYRWVDGHRTLWNNLKRHTLHEECPECGHLKTEYRDLGTKGYFECWWCRDRTADLDEVPA